MMLCFERFPAHPYIVLPNVYQVVSFYSTSPTSARVVTTEKGICHALSLIPEYSTSVSSPAASGLPIIILFCRGCCSNLHLLNHIDILKDLFESMGVHDKEG